MDQHLSPNCPDGQAGYCKGQCGGEAKQSPEGRWFLTMGHAGFNSPTNNRGGYRTQNAALAAHRRYAGRK